MYQCICVISPGNKSTSTRKAHTYMKRQDRTLPTLLAGALTLTSSPRGKKPSFLSVSSFRQETRVTSFAGVPTSNLSWQQETRRPDLMKFCKTVTSPLPVAEA